MGRRGSVRAFGIWMRSPALVLLLLVGCTEQPAAAPTSAQKVANGLVLRAAPAAVDLAVGSRATPSVELFDGEEAVAPFLHEGHATIEDETIASLEGAAIVAKAPGTTKLHVEVEQPPLFSGALDVPIVVHAAPPTAIAIEPVSSPRIGEAVPVRAVATWAEGTSDATWDVEWSTDSSLAMAPGIARAVAPLSEKPGRLRAKLGPLEAETIVQPAGKAPVGIEIRLAWAWMDQRRFGAFARYEDGEEREISAGCTWTVDDKPWQDPRTFGPRIAARGSAWNKTATCTVAGVKGSGSLFSP